MQIKYRDLATGSIYAAQVIHRYADGRVDADVLAPEGVKPVLHVRNRTVLPRDENVPGTLFATDALGR